MNQLIPFAAASGATFAICVACAIHHMFGNVGAFAKWAWKEGSAAASDAASKAASSAWKIAGKSLTRMAQAAAHTTNNLGRGLIHDSTVRSSGAPPALGANATEPLPPRTNTTAVAVYEPARPPAPGTIITLDRDVILGALILVTLAIAAWFVYAYMRRQVVALKRTAQIHKQATASLITDHALALEQAHERLADAFREQRARVLMYRAFVQWRMHNATLRHAFEVRTLQDRIDRMRNDVYTLHTIHRSTTIVVEAAGGLDWGV